MYQVNKKQFIVDSQYGLGTSNNKFLSNKLKSWFTFLMFNYPNNIPLKKSDLLVGTGYPNEHFINKFNNSLRIYDFNCYYESFNINPTIFIDSTPIECKLSELPKYMSECKKLININDIEIYCCRILYNIDDYGIYEIINNETVIIYTKLNILFKTPEFNNGLPAAIFMEYKYYAKYLIGILSQFCRICEYENNYYYILFKFPYIYLEDINEHTINKHFSLYNYSKIGNLKFFNTKLSLLYKISYILSGKDHINQYDLHSNTKLLNNNPYYYLDANNSIELSQFRLIIEELMKYKKELMKFNLNYRYDLNKIFISEKNMNISNTNYKYMINNKKEDRTKLPFLIEYYVYLVVKYNNEYGNMKYEMNDKTRSVIFEYCSKYFIDKKNTIENEINISKIKNKYTKEFDRYVKDINKIINKKIKENDIFIQHNDPLFMKLFKIYSGDNIPRNIIDEKSIRYHFSDDGEYSNNFVTKIKKKCNDKIKKEDTIDFMDSLQPIKSSMEKSIKPKKNVFYTEDYDYTGSGKQIKINVSDEKKCDKRKHHTIKKSDNIANKSKKKSDSDYSSESEKEEKSGGKKRGLSKNIVSFSSGSETGGDSSNNDDSSSDDDNKKLKSGKSSSSDSGSESESKHKPKRYGSGSDSESKHHESIKDVKISKIIVSHEGFGNTKIDVNEGQKFKKIQNIITGRKTIRLIQDSDGDKYEETTAAGSNNEKSDEYNKKKQIIDKIKLTSSDVLKYIYQYMYYNKKYSDRSSLEYNFNIQQLDYFIENIYLNLNDKKSLYHISDNNKRIKIYNRVSDVNGLFIKSIYGDIYELIMRIMNGVDESISKRSISYKFHTSKFYNFNYMTYGNGSYIFPDINWKYPIYETFKDIISSNYEYYIEKYKWKWNLTKKIDIIFKFKHKIT